MVTRYRTIVVLLSAALIALIALAGCTTVENLKPGVTRPGPEYRRGFIKTTEGLAMTVPDRSYEQVWAAAEKAVRMQLTWVDGDPQRGVIRAADNNFLGLSKGFVGVFITRTPMTTSAYTVEVSKILKNRTSADLIQDYEVTILRAIQTDVGGQ